MPKKTFTEFFSTDYLDSATNDVYQSIGSLVDGMKPTARKTIHTMLKNRITDFIKVEQLATKTAEQTEYLGGAGNIEGVLVNLGKNYVGSNQLPVVEKKGNFGSRYIRKAAAGRYIKAKLPTYQTFLLSNLDKDILLGQTFEGVEIEPRFFVPVIPMLFVNGSEGPATGFSQKIFPRKLEDIIKNVKIYLKGENIKSMPVFYRGFDGDIISGETNRQWIFKGKLEIESATRVRVSEIPLHYNFDSYNKVLSDLKSKGKIKRVEDIGENDRFEFIITLEKDVVSKGEDHLLNLLKLVKTDSEVLTAIDENNKVKVFDSVEAIFKAYCDIRLEYYVKRKYHMMEELDQELIILKNRLRFVQEVLVEKINIRLSKKEVEESLEQSGYDKVDDSLEYLLRMPIYSFCKDKIKELSDKTTAVEEEKKTISETAPEDMWLEDLKHLEKELKKKGFM